MQSKLTQTPLHKHNFIITVFAYGRRGRSYDLTLSCMGVRLTAAKQPRAVLRGGTTAWPCVLLVSNEKLILKDKKKKGK